MTLRERKKQMIEYLKLKLEEEDWHGTADAAMDLRDIEAEIVGLRRAAEIAFEVEAKHAPHGQSDCCKCDTSHAKADGAGIVSDRIQEEYAE